MTRHVDAPIEPVEPPAATTVGWLGLLLPFFVVLGAALLLGAGSFVRLEWMVVLLAVPVAIIALRRAAAHARGPTPRYGDQPGT